MSRDDPQDDILSGRYPTMLLYSSQQDNLSPRIPSRRSRKQLHSPLQPKTVVFGEQLQRARRPPKTSTGKAQSKRCGTKRPTTCLHSIDALRRVRKAPRALALPSSTNATLAMHEPKFCARTSISCNRFNVALIIFYVSYILIDIDVPSSWPLKYFGTGCYLLEFVGRQRSGNSRNMSTHR